MRAAARSSTSTRAGATRSRSSARCGSWSAWARPACRSRTRPGRSAAGTGRARPSSRRPRWSTAFGRRSARVATTRSSSSRAPTRSRSRGSEPALERAVAYADAGADVIFAEALRLASRTSRASRQSSRVPVLANMTEFGLTPLFTLEELRGRASRSRSTRSRRRARLRGRPSDVYRAIRDARGRRRGRTADADARRALRGARLPPLRARARRRWTRSGRERERAPEPDALLVELAAVRARRRTTFGDATLATARLVLADSLGCAALASTHPRARACSGPIVPGTVVPNGSRVPRPTYELDPVKAAFDIGALIRWLDFNDTWLAAEWGHPSDNLGAILALADHLARSGAASRVRDVLDASVVAHEIQGVLALDERVQSRRPRSRAAREGRVDGGSRPAARGSIATRSSPRCRTRGSTGTRCGPTATRPNTGSRKSWAAGDATARGLSAGAARPRAARWATRRR